MNDTLKVLFLGNHTVGVKVLRTLHNISTVIGVVAHPPDPEEGERYRSVFDKAKDLNLDVIRGNMDDDDVKKFIRQKSPDLLWVTDYKFILPQSVLSIPELGSVNLHPSLLPKYRGRASVNWAIINGEDRLGLTAHFMTTDVDAGDIITQKKFLFKPNEDIKDAHEKLYPLYKEITREVIGYFKEESVPRRKQDPSEATYHPARRPEDGLIDWENPAQDIHNLIRAVSKPYPGAFTYLSGDKLILWSALVSNTSFSDHSPGTIIRRSSDYFQVQCDPGVLKITEWEFPNQNHEIEPQKKLTVGDSKSTVEE